MGEKRGRLFLIIRLAGELEDASSCAESQHTRAAEVLVLVNLVTSEASRWRLGRPVRLLAREKQLLPSSRPLKVYRG